MHSSETEKEARVVVERTCTLGHYVTFVGNLVDLDREGCCEVVDCRRKLYTMSVTEVSKK
jgi:hypothetical protein